MLAAADLGEGQLVFIVRHEAEASAELCVWGDDSYFRVQTIKGQWMSYTMNSTSWKSETKAESSESERR